MLNMKLPGIKKRKIKEEGHGCSERKHGGRPNKEEFLVLPPNKVVLIILMKNWLNNYILRHLRQV